jgi:two-component system, response regulator / RNA-binding antiterminator
MVHCNILAAWHHGFVDSSLSILIIDENGDRAALIELGLREAGHTRVATIRETKGILKQIEDIAPDVIMIDLGNSGRDLLEHMLLVSRTVRRPIAMFVDKSDEQAMYQAIEAGVSAYVVDGLKKERIKPILDLAMIRFKAFEKMRGERDAAHLALDDVKTIATAKRLLMKLKNISEPEAHELLRTTAMNQSKRMGAVAEAFIASTKLLDGQND